MLILHIKIPVLYSHGSAIMVGGWDEKLPERPTVYKYLGHIN